MRTAFLSILVLAGCETTLEVTLVAAAGEPDLDLSCVNVVEVIVQGNAPDDRQTVCLQVEPGTVRSMRDHGLDGMLDVPMPQSGLRFMWVTGMTSPISDCNTGDAIFHGGSEYEGGTSMPIWLHGSFDCANAAPRTLRVHAIDQTALATTGTCTAAAAGWYATGGYLLPTDVDIPGIAGTEFWPFLTTEAPVAIAAGATDLTIGYTEAEGDTCLAVALFQDGIPGANVACLPLGTRNACAPPGELEVGYLPVQNLLALADSSADLRSTTLVTLWDATLQQVVPNAQVTVDDEGGEIVYLRVDAGGFSAIAATQSDASGSFLVHSRHSPVITIEAPGYRTKTVRVGTDFVGGMVVILDRS